MPLRKHRPAVATGLAVTAAIAVAVAVVPSTANAGIFDILTPKAAATPTPKPVATPTPTPKPAATATPAPTVAATTTTASPAVVTTSSAVPAGASCTQLPTTKAFAKVDGDTSDYSLAPGGSFENGTAGWTMSSGAKIITGNETLGVSAGTHAAQIPLSGSITSPSFCVDASNPSFRFTYKVDNSVLSGFIAYVIYRDANGTVTNTQLVSSKLLAFSPSTWTASPKSPLSTLIPLNASAKTASVQLKITALNPTDFVDDTATAIGGSNAATDAVHTIGSAGSNLVATISGAVSPIANIGITVDSVEVDPYRRG